MEEISKEKDPGINLSVPTMIVLLGMFIAGGIGYGNLQSDVTNLKRDTDNCRNEIASLTAKLDKFLELGFAHGTPRR